MVPEETLLNQTKLETIISESKIKKYVLVLGFMHKPGYDSECNCYRGLIETINPSWILYEACDNCDNEPIYRDCTELVRSIEEHNFRTTSCDLTDDEKNVIKNENNPYYRINRPQYKKRNDILVRLLDRLYYYEREKRMGENILGHYKYTNKPIIIIIGHDHAGEYSNIHNILKGKTEYITFWKNRNCCYNCGTRLNKDDKNEYCSCCGADLYNLIIRKKT